MRVRYTKWNLESCITAAKKLAGINGGKSYIFATGLGYLISHEPPPFNMQDYLLVSDGRVALIKPSREWGD